MFLLVFVYDFEFDVSLHVEEDEMVFSRAGCVRPF